jgi:hypothetical protein
MSETDHIRRELFGAISYCGGQRALARALRVNERTVRRWTKGWPSGKIEPSLLHQLAISDMADKWLEAQGK